MSFCYILHSIKANKFYVGITHEAIESRLQKHNKSFYGKHFTSQADDWDIFLVIDCKSVSQSLKIEKYIKSMKSKIFIQNLKKYPELIQKLLQKYS